MRSLLIAGVATAVLGSAAAISTPVLADGVIRHCVWHGLTSGTTQVQCAHNVVKDPPHWWQSNDDNFQLIKQNQEAELEYNPYSTQQLQVGLNVVGEGDDNAQIIKQHQDLDNNEYYGNGGLQQLQVGVNTVEDGDDNKQVIKQSQSLQIGDDCNNTCAE